MSDTGMLAPYRVLDLTDERGLLCGMILADLGADVVHIEPPDGSPARRFGERGALWEAWARQSRSVALDLESDAGRRAFLDLVATADFLIESAEPGHMARIGLGPEHTLVANRSLIHVSITPFGSTGPKAGAPATDLTVQAAAGMLILAGEADEAPLHVRGSQAWAHAGAEAAVAALIAHHGRRSTGQGQWIDVSAQQATALAAGFQHLAGLLGSPPTGRSAGGVKVGPVSVPTIFETAEGVVSVTLWFGPMQAPYTLRLMSWICEEGECDESTRDKDWLNYLQLLLSGAEPLAELDRVIEIVKGFLRRRPLAGLFAEARHRRVMLVPCSTTGEMLENEHLTAREYWWRAHDLPGSPKVPGAFVRPSRTPLVYRRAAPRWPGEHTEEVRAELRTTLHWPGTEAGEALADLKVLDFSWIMAGPWSTRMLADFGAMVVKIENPGRLDGLRMMPPYIGARQEPEFSGGFQTMAAGKLSLALDPGSSSGRKVVLDLVRWADVIVESFSPKVMSGWNLAYDDLVKIRPDVILLSSSIFGQSGPYAQLPGVGTMGAALGGFVRMTGRPGRLPTGPWGPYTDFPSPRMGAAALLAALDHRARTGEGQHLDLSQLEASALFIAPELYDRALSGLDATPIGNTDPNCSPHGVYPATGDDEWVAIACRSNAEWRSLAACMGRSDLGDDLRLEERAARLDAASVLDAAISDWTRSRSADEIETTLLRAGVPAARLIDHRTLATDLQLVHRGHLVQAPHPLHGHTWIESTHVQLSRTPAHVRRAGPLLGEHTDQVLRDILGYDDARISVLRSDGGVPHQ